MALVEIFRTGTHTDSNGVTRTWTEADLDRMVSTYNPANHEAPVVIGHPANNAPAFGWVKALKREGSRLFAELHQVQQSFRDMVNQGLFKKRSISVYPDGRLRHIGFLGAVPPAVHGLQDVQLQGAPAVEVEVSGFSDNLDVTPPVGQHQPQFQGGHGHSQNALDFYLQNSQTHVPAAGQFAGAPGAGFYGTGGHAPANPTVTATATAAGAGHGGVSGPAPQAAQQGDYANMQQAMRVQQLEQELSGLRRDMRTRDWQQFADSLQQNGKLLPVQAPAALALMEALASLPQAISFADHDGQPVSRTPVALFQEFLATMPAQVELTEVARASRVAQPQGQKGPEDIARSVTAFMDSEAKAGRQLSYSQALQQVMAGNDAATPATAATPAGHGGGK